MQFPTQSLMRLPLKGAGIIPRRYQLNNVMCIWWINKTVAQSHVRVGSSSGNGTSSLPEAFSLSAPACTQQHHLPGKLRRTGFNRSSYTHPRSWAGLLGKCPKPRYPRDTHLLLLQPQFCLCLARLHRLEEFSKDKSSPATSGVFHLDSGADRVISPVLTEEGELKQSCGNKSCSGCWPNEVMSSFQGLGGLAAGKFAEMGAMQVPRQFYSFKRKTVPAVGACSF